MFTHHSRHSDNIERRSLDPLSEGRTRVPRLGTVVMRGTGSMLALGEHARLLLVSVSASRYARIGVSSSRSLVEETHCCGVGISSL
jgi:hypothetical protein